MTSAGLLLQGGAVFDGLGAPGRVADVAVAGGRVVAVRGGPPPGRRSGRRAGRVLRGRGWRGPAGPGPTP
jgi:hypothetical protein